MRVIVMCGFVRWVHVRVCVHDVGLCVSLCAVWVCVCVCNMCVMFVSSCVEICREQQIHKNCNWSSNNHTHIHDVPCSLVAL